MKIVSLLNVGFGITLAERRAQIQQEQLKEIARKLQVRQQPTTDNRKVRLIWVLK